MSRDRRRSKPTSKPTAVIHIAPNPTREEIMAAVRTWEHDHEAREYLPCDDHACDDPSRPTSPPKVRLTFKAATKKIKGQVVGGKVVRSKAGARRKTRR